MNLIRKVKLADVSLADTYLPPPAEPGQKAGEITSTLQNVIDILSQNPYIMYLNISCCNIPLPDLVRIAAKFENCAKMEYLSIAGNQILCHPDEALKDELVQYISDFIERPSSVLCHLDLSDIGFDPPRLRQILKALQKNTMLLSINLGHYAVGEETDMIRDVLQLQEPQAKVQFPQELCTESEPAE